MIVLLISSIWLARIASGKDKNEVGLYQETTFTTLNNENDLIDFSIKKDIERSIKCDKLIKKKTHKNFDWVLDCFKLDD